MKQKTKGLYVLKLESKKNNDRNENQNFSIMFF